MEVTKIGIETSAMLVEFNVSVWTARKLDKKTTDEVVVSKNAAAKDAARVNKHLLAGRTELDDIQQTVTRARNYVYEQTLPWSDSGMRLLPTAQFMAFNSRMQKFEDEINIKFEDFITVYPTLITAQAMALGDMFKRDDYPTQDEIRSKFAVRCTYMPVPTSGDFRVDIGNVAQEELKKTLDVVVAERIDAAMQDVKVRLRDHLVRMSDRLTTDTVGGEEKGRRFHDTLVSTACDLCELVKGLNLTNDRQLESARYELQQVIQGVTPEELRKNGAVRQEVKTRVDGLLGKFSW